MVSRYGLFFDQDKLGFNYHNGGILKCQLFLPKIQALMRIMGSTTIMIAHNANTTCLSSSGCKCSLLTDN